MKYYQLLLFIVLSYASIIPQWEYQFPPVDGLLISTDFVDSNNGVSSGWQFELSSASGKITYTTDGGENWFLANIPDSSRSINDIQMINPQLGYACGAYNITSDYPEKFIKPSEFLYPNKDYLHQWQMFKYALNPDQEDYSGIFLRTTNGGTAWITVGTLPDSIYYLGGLSFLDSLTGYIVSVSATYNNGKIFKTTDGGMSWNQQTFDNGINFWDIEFINHNKGIAVGYIVPPVGDLHGIIYWTENGGEEWHLLDFLEIDNFNHLSFNSLNTAYITGISQLTESIVYKSYNGGQSWEPTSSTLAANYFYDGIDFVKNTDEGIVYGTAFIPDSAGFNHMIPFISKSVDGGYNWFTPEEFDSLIDHLVLGSKLLNEDIWYVCGGEISKSIVLKTYNGGGFFDLVLTTPNGGEYWLMGELKEIIWESSNVDSVKIELSINNGMLWYTITESTPSDGVYEWIVQAPQTSWECRIKISDVRDTTIADESDTTFVIDILPSVEDSLSLYLPKEFSLFQNFPNPFNPITLIRYDIQKRSKIILKIYDELGNEIDLLVNEQKNPGRYQVEWDASGLPSGIYFYQLKTDSYIETKKMVLMK